MFNLKYTQLSVLGLATVYLLTGCQTPAFIGRNEFSTLPANSIISSHKTTGFEDIRITQKPDTTKVDNSYLLFKANPVRKTKNRVYGVVRFKNETEDPADDRYIYLRKHNSNIVAETILLDSDTNKSYFGVGEVGNNISALGAQIRFEY